MPSGTGETLRATRRAQGRTLADVAEATRVRETYLAALERGDFGSLGGDVYARGFLRSYARYLQLDPEPLVRAYLAEVSGAEAQRRERARVRRAGGPRRPASGAGPARRPAPRGGDVAGPQAPQERPPGAAVLLVLVVIVLLVVAFVGLRGAEAAAADVAGAGEVAAEEGAR